MSLCPRKHEPARLEYHAAKLFAGQGIRGAGKTYDDLKPAYQIALLAKDRFFGDADFFHSFEYYDPARGVSLGGRTRILTLELAKLEAVARKPIDEMSNRDMWAMFFEYLTDPAMRAIINAILDRKEGITMAAEVLLTISRDEVERARLRSEEKNLLDIQSEMVHERREGRREGKREGIKEGRREGMMEGEKKNALSNARNALAEGLSFEQVHRITGLDIQTIQTLQL